MKVFPKILSTTFVSFFHVDEVSKEQVMDKGQDFLLRQGLKAKVRNEDEIKFRTRIGHHFAYHPFFLIISVKLAVEKSNKSKVKYTVSHWIPFVILSGFSLKYYQGYSNPYTYIPFIVFMGYIFFIALVQRSIFKELIQFLNEKNNA